MTVTERVAALLASLGETADNVAASLRKRRITGTPEDPCYCPIANLIRGEFPQSDVQGWTSDPDDKPGWCVSPSAVFTSDGVVPVPPAVRAFIERFDGHPAAARFDDPRSGR